MNLVKLTDLDDYLMPAQDCVVISSSSKQPQAKGKLLIEDELEPKPAFSGVKKPNLIKKDAETDKAVVSLYDCLACSGCVTSSEVVLMEQHGVKNMLALLEKAAVGALVLSPQSRAALCTELGLAPRDLMFKLEAFLRRRGCSQLLDLQFFVDLHQNLHYAELLQAKSGPLISSECPGWICYVEKIVKEPLIKLCSRIKSPLMLAGDLLRRLFGLAGVLQEAIALVGVAPCHDKKLETFRPETATDPSLKNMDIVLTTAELLELIAQHRQEFDAIALDPTAKVGWQFDELLKAGGPLQEGDSLEQVFARLRVFSLESHPLYTNSTTSATSNNYLNQVLMRLFKDRAGLEVAESSITETLRKNKKGFGEVEYLDEASGQKFVGARVYGFKNIQNLIRQLKTASKTPYEYIELMACPGGCFNGGGQLRKKDASLDGLREEYERLSQKHLTCRYFYQNLTAAGLARAIFEGSTPLATRQSIEYNIQPLQASDNPVQMKW